MKNIARWDIFKNSLKLIILLKNETLKLVESKRNSGLVIPMYIINIRMDPSI
jgi:hypothetical protein